MQTNTLLNIINIGLTPLPNFVNIVGYQLEKVHTGVIKWCLDSGEGIQLSDLKFDALSDLYKCLNKKIPFEQNDVVQIKCTPEYSFGRKVRIDLFIEITTKSSHYYVACEMKVDSDPYKSQLDQTVDMVEEKFKSKENTEYLLVLIGASVVQRSIGDKHDTFHVLSSSDLINIFNKSRKGSYIVSDWLDSLSEELARERNILNNFRQLYSLGLWEKKQHIDMGYRPFFSTYYYLYSEMRNYSKASSDWQIYSGSNNPVMNLEKGWKTVGDFEFYWEFNYLEFCFKVKIDQDNVSSNRLNLLRDAIYPILDSVNCSGKRTQKRYGKWNSIYKWSFDLSTQNCSSIFKNIEDEILPIYEKVCSIAINI